MSGWFWQQWVVAIWLGFGAINGVWQTATCKDALIRFVCGFVYLAISVGLWYTLYSLGVFTNFQELAASLGL